MVQWKHMTTSSALPVSKSIMWQLLLQVGEFDLVISLGTKLLAKWESRPFRRDVLLSMALAQCGLASEVFGLQQVGTAVRGPAVERSCCSVSWPDEVLGLQQVVALWEASGSRGGQVLPQAGQQRCWTCSRYAFLNGVLL